MTSYRNSDPRPPIMTGSPVSPAWRAPRADWDRPPWNRWSFQHIREILPTVEVSCGNAPRGTGGGLSAALQDIGAVTFEAVDGSRKSVETMLDETYTDGFIVIRNGAVVHESYFNGMAPDSRHLSQSVAKSVTGTVAGILIGKQMLDPQAPITEYLPELAATAWNGATVQHALDMTSGVAFDEEYTSVTSDIGQTDVASGWKPVPPDAPDGFDWPATVWVQILGLKEQEAEHGSRFKYRSIETDVVAHCLERVSGKRLADLVSNELWVPMGAEQDAYFTVDSGGYALADGGFNACLRDYARIGMLYLNDGRSVDGRQVLSPDWVADVRRGPHGLFSDDYRDMLPNGCYRNTFWVADESRETIMALGVFGQMIHVSPETGMVVAKLSSWPDFLDDTHFANTLRAIDAIAEALG